MSINYSIKKDKTSIDDTTSKFKCISKMEKEIKHNLVRRWRINIRLFIKVQTSTYEGESHA